MNAVRLDGACFVLGGRTVLKALTLTIPQGVFVGVLGPNGAGKTTLLRALLGLERPASGSVEVLGHPAEPGRAAVGYMPQTRASLADLRLSGRDFVAAAAGGVAWGLPRLSAAQHADVARVLRLVDATAYAHRAVRALSGGERQRLLLAQALLGTPRLLLLDEPLVSLDPQHQAGIVRLVAGLQKQLGITVLFSAHELTALLPVLDQVLYLGGGRAALGTVDEVINAETLSGLYGGPIGVIRAQGRVFIVADPAMAP